MQAAGHAPRPALLDRCLSRRAPPCAARVLQGAAAGETSCGRQPAMLTSPQCPCFFLRASRRSLLLQGRARWRPRGGAAAAGADAVARPAAGVSGGAGGLHRVVGRVGRRAATRVARGLKHAWGCQGSTLCPRACSPACPAPLHWRRRGAGRPRAACRCSPAAATTSAGTTCCGRCRGRPGTGGGGARRMRAEDFDCLSLASTA